jgi:leucyl/phenylalanyl-tRNA--protein transferase
VGESRWKFPPPAEWPSGDVVAAGGDLAPATLVAAYRQGLFPMAVDGSEPVLGWWSPDPRGIVPLDGLGSRDRCGRARSATRSASTPASPT